LIFISTLFISRSSIIAGFLVYLFYILSYLRFNRNNFLLFILPLIFSVSLVFIAKIFLTGSFLKVDWFFWAFDWAQNYLDTGTLSVSNSSTDQLFSQTQWDFDLLGLLLGNGFYAGISNWLIQSDSGYWRMLNSLGLISILFYFITIIAIIKFLPFSGFTSLLFILTFLIFEFKEPFFVQNYSSRLLYFLLIIGWRFESYRYYRFKKN
jgi:hypothetical protein